MKCESAEQNVLLEQSGELKGLRRWLTIRHVRSCAQCRQYRADLNRVTAAARDAMPDLAPGEGVMEQIRAVARKESSRSVEIRFRPSREPLSTIFRPALLYSALGLLVLMGFWLVLRPVLRPGAAPVQVARTPVPAAAPAPAAKPDVSWDDDMDDQIASLGDMLAAASGDSNGADTIEDMDSVARELLELEGEEI